MHLASVREARWSSKPQDGVRLPGEVLETKDKGNSQRHVPGVCRIAHKLAKLEDQVQFPGWDTAPRVSRIDTLSFGATQVM
ncbi:MAG: hypothetical protein CL681_21945 [Blastopirellula sp.]|nr:hypothetical protein [Blastopirellula sp.]